MSKWLPWVLGSALLVAVIAAGLHYSEGRDWIRLVQQAHPAWLTVAIALQISTYLAQGGIWRLAGATTRRLSRVKAFELSLVKLFADQAIPTAGLSSSVLVSRGLKHYRVPTGAVKAAVLINIASYHLAYVLALLAALIIIELRGRPNIFVVTLSVLFLLFSAGLSAAILALAGTHHPKLERVARRFRPALKGVRYLRSADASLVRGPKVLFASVGFQLAIVLLDAATIWVLILSLGSTAPVSGVFASFMVASLLRTMGFIPGGLGTFEATSVVTLRMAGVPVSVGLAATLLFRGLSFWLPMLPGYWFSHRFVAARRRRA